MPALSHLIIGLGNPGEEYARTRHNIGFMAVDEIAARENCAPWKKKFKGETAAGGGFLLLKPHTYMNLSGESARAALDFHNLKTEQVVVFHDDLDLLPGQVKIKQGGGAGGHNGLKSLDAHIGPDYWRVRLGIGRPATEQGLPIKGEAVTNYVLNPFARADKEWLAPLLGALADNFSLILKNDFAAYAASLPKPGA